MILRRIFRYTKNDPLVVEVHSIDINPSYTVLLSTHSHDSYQWEESDLPACGPPASFSVHLASSTFTPAEALHKSRGDTVVLKWMQLKS